MDRWHLARGEHRAGPYSWAQLVEMARGGQIAPTDLIWQEGSPQWLPASTYADRLPLGGAVRPPPPANPGLLFHLKRAFEWNLRVMPVTASEEQLLIGLGVDDDDARRYHVWRRSVLRVVFVGGCVAAALAIVGLAGANEENYTSIGHTADGVRVLSLMVLPLCAWLAGRVWSRHKRSRRLFTIGWVISFATPLLLALIPTHWRYELGAVEGAERIQAEATLRLVGAISYYITLMPGVLALIPGVMRACLRIKVLLPQSILPGWFLVGAAPLWTLLFLVVFVTVNQLAGDGLLIVGVLCVTGAPILYLVHVGVFTRPSASAEDEKMLLKVQRQVRLVLSGGVVFLLIWIVTAKLFGRSIIGVDPETSMVRPWSLDLFRFPIDYAAHSLATTALAADLFMAMNLSVWQHTRAFVTSPAATEYDRRMSEIEEAGEKE